MSSSGVHVVQPDSRGRVGLRRLIDQQRSYTATRDDDGTVVLTPIAHVLSDAAYADLQADPHGYARLLDRSRAIGDGAPTVTSTEFWQLVDNDNDA